MMTHLDVEKIKSVRINTWERLAGIYYLFDGDEIVYIGQTTNLYARLGMHHNKRFDSFALINCLEKERTRYEREAIYAFCPRYNRGSHNTPLDLIEEHKLCSVLCLPANQVKKALAKSFLKTYLFDNSPHFNKDEAYEWANRQFRLPRLFIS
jgi:hypothetical protein